MVFAPDPYCTYSLCMYTGPVGAKMVIEGEFPHCRYFDIQISPPLDPTFPLTDGIGAPEVPIVDVNIDPLPGNVNPFRPGEDRNAPNRRYRYECELSVGNAYDLNPEVLEAPYYRAPMSKMRKVGCFNYSGYMGDGRLLPCVIWMRYYLPDEGAGPLGGMPLPKVHFELPSGEKYWLQPDWGLSSMRVDTVIEAQETPAVDPAPFIGPNMGWLKLYGLHLIYVEVFALRAMGLFGKGSPQQMQKLVPEWDRVLWGRGPDVPKPGCYEISATTCTNINYLGRIMSLGKGKVAVIAGKMPTFPKTRHGESTMEPAQVRYWSFTRLHETPDFTYPGISLGQLHDEEVILDDDRRYVIAFSRKEDRPVNAVPEAGVTWQNWGPDAVQYFLIRWLSVAPEHGSFLAPGVRCRPQHQTRIFRP
jgi:hypothetical protein